MKINTKQAIKSLKNEDIKTPEGTIFTIGTPISNILLESKDGGKMKMFILAQKFFSDEIVDLDESDLILVKNAIEKTEQYNNLVTGQILQFLNKEEVTPPKKEETK